MKEVKLSTRIGLGFGLIITIMLTLGGVAIWQMNAVGQESERLSAAYVPEVVVSSAVERAYREAGFEMRAYGYTGNDTFYASGRKLLDETQTRLQEAKRLADDQQLPELQEQTRIADEALQVYNEQLKETRENTVAMKASLAQLDTYANVFVTRVDEFLKGQKDKLDTDLDERQAKINFVQAIQGISTQARVTNFKGQAQNDPSLMAEAADLLDGVEDNLQQMRQITRLPEDLAQLDKIEEASEGYQQAIRGYRAEFIRGEEADPALLTQAVTVMDANAGALVQAGETFLLGQQAKLASDFDERMTKIRLVTEIANVGNSARVRNFKAQSTRDMQLMVETINTFDQVNALAAKLRPITHLAEDNARIDDIVEATNQYKASLVSYVENWERAEQLNGIRTKQYHKIIESFVTTSDLGLQHASKISTDATQKLSHASWVTIIGLVVAVVAGIGLAAAITITVGKSIRAIIVGLTDASDQVASASGQVSQSSQQLAEGASQQAAGVEETSSSLEELASMTRQNAENASKANSTMETTTQVVSEANQAMGELIGSMQEIATSSEETQKIIKTIDEIAFQTNLLALNAAVEAARAGEAGAGFAVVADEVRNLAIRAADAAKNTADLIEGSVQRISVGTDLVNRTNEAFTRVHQGAVQVGGLVDEIATASKEQSNGIDQINRAVSEMDKVVQQNASSSEESAAAAQEMSAQAVTLKDYVESLIRLVEGAKGSMSTGKRLVAPSLSRTANGNSFSANGHPRSNGHAPVASNGMSIQADDSDLTFFDQQN